MMVRCSVLLFFAVAAAQADDADPLPDNHELGRLFTTPEQRISLDARRGRVPGTADTIQLSPQETTREKEVVGLIVRQGRRPLVWVDGQFTRAQSDVPAPALKTEAPAEITRSEPTTGARDQE